MKEANRRQMRDPAFVQELIGWIRFSRSEVKAHQDGLAAPVMGMPSVPRWMGKRITWAALRPESEARRAEKLIRSSPLLALFIAERHDREHWVKLGESFERFALAATALGLKHAHMNMPCEVPEVRAQLRKYLGLELGEPLLLLRCGYGEAMPRSPRRPLAEVLA